MSLLDEIGSLLSGAGYALDTPGALLRGLMAGRPGERASGRDMLESWGALDPNQEGFDLGDVAGFGADLAADPLNILGGAGLLKMFRNRPITEFAEAATGAPFRSKVFRAGPGEFSEKTGKFWSDDPEIVQGFYANRGGQEFPVKSATVGLQNPYVHEGTVPQFSLIDQLADEGDPIAKALHKENWWADGPNDFVPLDEHIRNIMMSRGHDGMVYRGDPYQGGNELVQFLKPSLLQSLNKPSVLGSAMLGYNAAPSYGGGG